MLMLRCLYLVGGGWSPTRAHLPSLFDSAEVMGTALVAGRLSGRPAGPLWFIQMGSLMDCPSAPLCGPHSAPYSFGHPLSLIGLRCLRVA